MILVVPMERSVLTGYGFVTEMMTVEICLMKLTVQMVRICLFNKMSVSVIQVTGHWFVLMCDIMHDST